MRAFTGPPASVGVPRMSMLRAQFPRATTRRGWGIALYATRRGWRIRLVIVPVTSRTSACRGDATIPRGGHPTVTQLPGPLSPSNRGRVRELSTRNRGHSGRRVNHEPGPHTNRPTLLTEVLPDYPGEPRPVRLPL